GSCLSSLLGRPDADSRWTPRFPFYTESGRQEPVALCHLRNNSNYLVDDGALGYFSAGAVFLRGLLVNILALLPAVVAAVGLTQWAYGTALRGGIRAGLSPYALTMLAAVAFAAAVVLYPLLVFVGNRRSAPAGLDARARVRSVYGGLLGCAVVLALVESLPLVLGWYHRASTGGTVLEGSTWASLLGSLLGGRGSDGEPGVLQKLSGVLKTIAAAAAGPLLLLMAYLVMARWVVFPGTAPVADAWAPWVVYGTGAALLVYALVFFDANSTSFHRYYRDRLSQAYLFQVDATDGPQVRSEVRPTDALRLSALNAEGTVAPYHLVNTALNLQGSTEVELRGRRTDFFLFSKHFTGSLHAGYCRTRDMEAADRHLDLGTAMAISGAAASPNMGTMTIRSLSLLMTLLNVRLGYWLVNPRRAAAGQGGVLSNLGAGLVQLSAEALSRTTAKGRYVNVSDGGHIENLGLYELLRRRCRVIVCGDGEADPDMAFNGLATVVRFAATDMGVHIDINLEGLAKDEDGRSRQNYAIGRIDYGDGEVGWLLYIKLSLGERELPYIEEYRHENPVFPHQSTGDQFFDEAQFEAYRALGFKIGLRTMAALDELREAAGDERLLSFTPGEESAGEEEDAEILDAVERSLSRRFVPAADSKPPW
ncbi:MAG: hypothetical protein KDK70_35000, partial [Myxococcales bacterium]|nr:hypothetical protein [Myxococcales bacterium]